jgi:hypothetical protein
VIEAFNRLIALIFDQRIVRPAQVGEAPAAVRLHALRFRVGDLRKSEPEHAAGSGISVTADEHGAGTQPRVERHERDVLFQ